MAEGTVVRMIRDRGFGFIRTEPDGEEVFFHATAVADGQFDAMQEGQQVEFDKVRDPRGRGMRAENVRAAQGASR
jgi:CspA family cold shock protein